MDGIIHLLLKRESERKDFTGIEDWNTSNVIDMKNMFAYSIFNQDISKWDTSKVVDMSGMFEISNFNQDISNWNTNNLESNYYQSIKKQDKNLI